MSERSIKRATARREAAERRREELRRRRAGLIVGAAIGASVLAAAPAQAATLTVTSALDRAVTDPCGEDCTLRDRLAQANDGDTIVFAPGVFGTGTRTIVLTEGELVVDSDVEVRGPGAAALTVRGQDDGDGTLDAGDSRIFRVTRGDDAEISGLTLTGGGSAGDRAGDGGAVFLDEGSQLRLVDSTVSGNVAERDGGAIHAYGADLELIGSTISGNTAARGGGVSGLPGRSAGGPFDLTKYERLPNLTLTATTVSGNTATGDGGGVLSSGGLRVRRSAVSGNTSEEGRGGGIAQFAIRSLDVADSVVADNRAPGGAGGGIAIGGRSAPKYSGPDTGELRTTVVSGNQAADGAGVAIGSVGGLSLSVVNSTLSGNAATDTGGGLLVQPDGGDGADLDGRIELVQSTVSGNAAAVGAGIAVGSQDSGAAASEGIALTSSTVAANRASARGGGLYLSGYGFVPVGGTGTEETSATVTSRSTIFGDNTAADAPQDLDRADGSQGGGLDADFTLVEARGDVDVLPLREGAANVLALDPQLGALGDNGGPTATHLPALTSPAVDRGDAPDGLDSDQRNRDRTVDLPADNAPRGDGTDIGAVEVERPADPPPPPPPAPAAAASTTVIVQQQATFTRIRALRLTARVTPGRDTAGPRTFRTTGRLILPPGITRRDGCASIGLVAVRVAVGNRTISTRRVRLRPDCTYRSAVTFSDPRRFGRRTKLLFTPRFLGNQRVFPISTRPGRRVRVRE